MKLKFLVLTLLFPGILYAQGKRAIRIYGVTTVTLSSFYLAVEQNNNKIKVSYKIPDSLSSKVKFDQDYIALNKEPHNYIIEESSGGVSQKYLDKLTKIFDRYYIYTTDSLQFSKSKNRGYSMLVDKIVNVEKQIDNRVILDGTSIKVDIYDGKLIKKTIQVHSPDANSNPLIAQFITETFDLFRKGKQDKYLTVRRTSGY